MPVVMANQAAELPPEAKAWLLLSLLIMLLIGGVLVALLLGRMLGPRGPWARSMTALKKRQADDTEPPIDAWAESARRMGADGNAAQDELESYEPDDDDPDDDGTDAFDDDEDDSSWR